MEAINKAIARIGKTWSPAVNAEMQDRHEVLHEAQAGIYEGSIQTAKALKYGPDARNRIDVYSPKQRQGLLPVVVYIHGGALLVGDNDVTQHIHGNIGMYTEGIPAKVR